MTNHRIKFPCEVWQQFERPVCLIGPSQVTDNKPTKPFYARGFSPTLVHPYFPGGDAGEMGEETGPYTPHKGVL